MSRILLVYAKGGVPLEHAIPRIAACGELHVLAVSPLPAAAKDEWMPCCRSIAERWSEHLVGERLVNGIVEHANALRVDAVLALSEYVLLATALATERLGLRGPGQGTWPARDKRLMRETWRDAGLSTPRFRRVGGVVDLRAACAELDPPLLLKPAWGAGSIGQVIVREQDEAAAAWDELSEALRRSAGYGLSELYETRAARHLLVEEIVRGSAAAWYEQPGYGDYLSVEGIVADGTYHPICITARMPTASPFTELSSSAPCVLPEPAQDRIEEVARRAVDALGLGTCGTHTEIKLGEDGELVVIESAARFGGSAITKVVESVFGVDLVTLLVRQLLGEQVAYPTRMLVEGQGAAAEMSLMAIDAQGKPWGTTPVWDSRAVDLSQLLSPGSTIEVVRGLTVPDGTRMPAYDGAGGISNCAGMLFLIAKDAGTLLADLYGVFNGLEGLLNSVSGV